MRDTRVTLLLRIRDPGDEEAWSEFHGLYAPLLYQYARQRGLADADAEEIRDQCLLIVAQKIGTLEYDRQKGGFKNWLRCIAEGKVVDFFRKRREPLADSRVLQQLPDPRPAPAELWEQQWRYQHVLYCAAQVKAGFSPQTYRAFELLAFDGCSVADVCAQLQMTRNQVYLAKSRVLRRIRARIIELGLTL
jgi:RNA polymerase sigma factor (sigma-70 family)